MKNISVSLLIPVYNEEKRINKTFDALLQGFDYAGLKLEKVIFVSDGSIDNTVEILNQNKAQLATALNAEVVVASYPKNRGKGHAIKYGMTFSDSDYTLFFDADMATPISEVIKFIPFMQKGLPVIIGTRKNGHSTVVIHQPKIREILGKGFTYLTNIMLNTWVTDFTCGFKAFDRESKNAVFTRSKIDKWSYDAEILFLARKLGFKIQEKAVVWSDDRNSKVKILKSVYTSLKELMQIRYYQLSGQYSGLGINLKLLKQTIQLTKNIIGLNYGFIGNLKLSRKA